MVGFLFKIDTPPKSNIDTKNDGFKMYLPFKYGYSGVSMLLFGGCKGELPQNDLKSYLVRFIVTLDSLTHSSWEGLLLSKLKQKLNPRYDWMIVKDYAGLVHLSHSAIRSMYGIFIYLYLP